MQLKMPRLSVGLKLSNHKLGCREDAIRSFVKQIPPTDSWHQVDSDRCDFHPLMPALTLVSLLGKFLVLETAMPRGDIGTRPSAHL
jgi:hypothetical protein